MLKTILTKRRHVCAEARALVAQGAEAIRIAIKRPGEARVAHWIRKEVTVPLVADIHFNYKLALEAIDSGFEGIRLNPLNITDVFHIKEVVQKAKRNDVAIRVGINSGGFKKSFSSEASQANAMVSAVSDFIRILESKRFTNITVSLKAATVRATIAANRLFAKKSRYPLHLGVTATGPFLDAVVKSSIGIGVLLEEGIGSIIRVSLTAPSDLEIRVAKILLQALHLRSFGPEIISCPTCSRCQVDLIRIVDTFNEEMEKAVARGKKFPSTIALMGCEVNGPGEARQADIGVAFGNKRGIIFQKGEIVGQIAEKNCVQEFLKWMEAK